MPVKPIVILLSLLFVCTCNFAQVPGNTIEATTLDITDSSKTVVARMVLIPGLKREMFLKSCSQLTDTSGNYLTIYRFAKPNHAAANNFSVILQFNKTFEALDFVIDGACENLKTVIADNKLSASLHASRLSPDGFIEIKFTSKQRIIPTISGISGQL